MFTQLRRLPAAKVPKNDMHACKDALLTIYNGHIVAKACEELEIKNPSEDPLPSTTVDLKKIATKLSTNARLCRKPLEETGDGKYNYARYLCHYTALVSEFRGGTTHYLD